MEREVKCPMMVAYGRMPQRCGLGRKHIIPASSKCSLVKHERHLQQTWVDDWSEDDPVTT